MNIDSTCLLCIEYADLMRGLPSNGHYIRSIDLFHQAHHGRSFIGTRTRAQHFIFLLSEYIVDEQARRVAGDIGTGLLRSRRIKKRRSRDTVFVDVGEERQARAKRLAEFTQGECLCGCGQGLLTATRMFRQGHDARFKAWLRKIERGDMSIDDSRIPDRARQVMIVLPKCKCCGQPIMDDKVNGGYGEKCATGECSCQERNEARIKAANRKRKLREESL